MSWHGGGVGGAASLLASPVPHLVVPGLSIRTSAAARGVGAGPEQLVHIIAPHRAGGVVEHPCQVGRAQTDPSVWCPLPLHPQASCRPAPAGGWPGLRQAQSKAPAVGYGHSFTPHCCLCITAHSAMSSAHPRSCDPFFSPSTSNPTLQHRVWESS